MRHGIWPDGCSQWHAGRPPDYTRHLYECPGACLKITSELVYDGATSLGRPPYCNLRVSPSSERLHNQIWLHRFDVISLSIVSGRICDINTI